MQMPSICVSARPSVPSALITQSCGDPPRLRWRTICEPSGDQSGPPWLRSLVPSRTWRPEPSGRTSGTLPSVASNAIHASPAFSVPGLAPGRVDVAAGDGATRELGWEAGVGTTSAPDAAGEAGTGVGSLAPPPLSASAPASSSTAPSGTRMSRERGIAGFLHGRRGARWLVR